MKKLCHKTTFAELFADAGYVSGSPAASQTITFAGDMAGITSPSVVILAPVENTGFDFGAITGGASGYAQTVSVSGEVTGSSMLGLTNTSGRFYGYYFVMK